MRQKENLEQLLESLLLGGGEEQQYKQEHHSLPPLSLFSTMEAPASQPALLGPDIQEIKLLLIKVRSLLEKDSASETGEAGSEARQEEEARQELEARLQEMRGQLAARDRRIEQLERLVHTRKENAATQTGRRVVRPGGRVSPAKSLHNLTGGPTTSQPRPCQHSWGPCANDHSYHHSRSMSSSRAGRPASPWSFTSVTSSSSGSFHLGGEGGGVRAARRSPAPAPPSASAAARYKKRALSADLLNNNTGRQTKSSERNDHKISIYVHHSDRRIKQ